MGNKNTTLLHNLGQSEDESVSYLKHRVRLCLQEEGHLSTYIIFVYIFISYNFNKQTHS